MLPVSALILLSCTDYDKKGWQMTPDELTDTSITSFILKATYEGTQYQYTAVIRNDSILVRVPYRFDFTVVSRAKADVSLANMATIYPLGETELDYSQPGLTFTVTAPDQKTTKEYKFGYEPYGFGDAYQSWYKTWAELGYQTFDSQGNETSYDEQTSSVGVCGDYLVAARSHWVFDRFTGEKLDFELNVTGVAPKPDGTSEIFWLTNDDEGNLVGSTLPVVSNGAYNIYKWTDPREAPTLVWESTVDAGRRIDVRGDINGTAYITSWLTGTDQPVIFHRIKIQDGVVTELPELNSGRRRLTDYGNNWPCCSLKEPADETTYYVFTNYLNDWDHGPCISYGTTDGPTTVVPYGPLEVDLPSYSGYVGWGNEYRHYAGVKNINGDNYLVVMNGYDTWGASTHYLAVAEVEEFKNWWQWSISSATLYYVPQLFSLQWNPNRNMAITVYNDGDKSYLYAMATGSGIACHILETSWD